MLFSYLQQTQRFIRDTNQEYENPADLTIYINRARRELALRTQSIRIIPPVQGPVTSLTIVNGGTLYTAPVLKISPPDFPSGALPNPMGVQATATAALTGTVISGASLTAAGNGYFQPAVTITDPHGSGAVITAQVASISTSVQGQEIFQFSAFPISGFPGVKSVFGVKSVSLIYANYRYSLPIYSFSVYQAMIRQYPRQYLYVPTMGSQFGQGTAGSFYLYPIPSQAYQIEFDCFCLPIDLVDDTTVEAIPDPWTDAVPYFAAHLAYLELQNLNSAKFYLDLYDNFVHRYSGGARVGRAVNIYGRY